MKRVHPPGSRFQVGDRVELVAPFVHMHDTPQIDRDIDAELRTAAAGLGGVFGVVTDATSREAWCRVQFDNVERPYLVDDVCLDHEVPLTDEVIAETVASIQHSLTRTKPQEADT